jgi:hypothetical protein
MSLVLHFIKKDLRRASWLFAIWFLLFVVEGILMLSAHAPVIDHNFMGRGLPMLASRFLFPLLHILVLAILVPQIIQEDALVGSTAFWLTRPVSRGALFMAKMVVLGLVVLIPIVVNLAILAVVGLSPGELGLATAEILMEQLVWIAVVAVIAALTPNFFKFSVVTVLVAVVIGIILPNIPIAVHRGLFDSDALARTRAIIKSALLIAGGGLILTHQYLTRRSRRSVVFATCFAGAYLLAGAFWPWNLERDEPLRSSNTNFDPAKVTLQVDVAQLNSPPINSFIGSIGKNVDGSYRLQGISPELLVQIRSANPRLNTTDGTAVKTLGAIPTLGSSPFQFDPPATYAISAALDGIPVYTGQRGGSMATLVTVDNATFQRYQNSPLKLTDDVDLVVSRYVVAAELPLVIGSHFDCGRVRVKIDDLVPRADGIKIVVVESAVNLFFGHSPDFYGQSTDPRLQGDPIYLLVNRGRKEAALINTMTTRWSARDSSLSGLLDLQSIDLPFSGSSSVMGSQWLAGATLVRLERVPVAEFRKPFEVELPKLGEPWLAYKAQAGKSADKTMELPYKIKVQSNTGIVIRVSNGTMVAVDGKAVTDEQFEALLVRAHKADANVAVFIVVVDVSVPKKLSFVMDACRMAGINKFSLEQLH